MWRAFKGVFFKFCFYKNNMNWLNALLQALYAFEKWHFRLSARMKCNANVLCLSIAAMILEVEWLACNASANLFDVESLVFLRFF